MLIVYMPLEPYIERYTWFLQEWVLERWKGKVDLISIGGEQIAGSEINVGSVLDAYGRTYWSAIQTATLIEWLKDGNEPDVIFFQDLYHSGFSALPYIFDQLEKRPLIFTWCWAQSVDPHDFTFPMRKWMRHYEMMVDKVVDGIFVADESLKQYMEIGMFESPIYPVGLPYDRDRIRNLVEEKPLDQRSMRVLFSSRWDREKQPGFFMDLIGCFSPRDGIEFAVSTGSKELRSNAPELLRRAVDLSDRGRLKIYEGMDKGDYYRLLADSRVQINSARQDFVSFTLLDASTMGTPSLLPAYLSFPEHVNYDYRFLYTPWDLESARTKLLALISDPPEEQAIRYASMYNHKTLDRVLNILEAQTYNREAYGE